MLGTPWAGRCSSSGGSAPPSRMFWALPSHVVCPGWDGELCASDAFGVGRSSLQRWLWAAPSTSTARCCLLVGCQRPVAGAWSLERGDEEEGVCPEHFPKAFCNQSPAGCGAKPRGHCFSLLQGLSFKPVPPVWSCTGPQLPQEQHPHHVS